MIFFQVFYASKYWDTYRILKYTNNIAVYAIAYNIMFLTHLIFLYTFLYTYATQIQRDPENGLCFFFFFLLIFIYCYFYLFFIFLWPGRDYINCNNIHREGVAFKCGFYVGEIII